jgi:phenylalanyl-tRNA synthetase alpha chain
MKYLNREELKRCLGIEDLTQNENHVIGILTNNIISKLSEEYIDTTLVRGNPIVKSIDNYDNLYYPSDTITKSSIYTRWVDSDTVLRTQMTSIIPETLRNLNSDDVLLVCPGIVYRRDQVDRCHTGEPHQMDVWRITKGVQYNREDLLELVQCVIDSILPNTKWRYNETEHYYTKDGIEVEVYLNGEWLEILECGLALPQLLTDCGLYGYSGLALGIGLDRSAMLRKNINDIRVLRSSNERITKQMSNLDEYREVSLQPSIKRDISIVTLENNDIEQIGDIIRGINGSEVIEEVIIKNEWDYSELPEKVVNKLGMKIGTKNVLLSITIRPIDRTMTNEEANHIYNEVYKKLDVGSNNYIIR